MIQSNSDDNNLLTNTTDPSHRLEIANHSSSEKLGISNKSPRDIFFIAPHSNFLLPPVPFSELNASLTSDAEKHYMVVTDYCSVNLK